MEYRYGMRMRGFSLGCQPKQGFIERQDDTTGKYYDVIVYDRELTEEEVDQYDLDLIKEDRKMAKGLSYEEFIELAKKNYSKGGDVAVECWDERTFNEYVKNFGPMTKKEALQTFRTWHDEQKESAAAMREALKADENTGLKFKDMIFEQEEVNGNLVWAARIHVIDRFVTAAYEHTKKDCMKAARQWIHRVNEDFDRFLEGLRELDEQELTEQTTVQPEEDVVDAFLLGYLPKKKQMAVVRLTKDDDGYHATVASGETVDRRTWKEFMKAFREVAV